MTRIKVLFVTAILLCLIFISGCGTNTEKFDGISGDQGNYSYRVKLGNREIRDIFTLVGTPSYIHTTVFGASGSGEKSSAGANYCKVAEGGWVAYNGSEFIYMPHVADRESASFACPRLANQTEDVMTLEEFGEHFDFAK